VREPGALLDAVAEMLAGYGARSWQIGLTAPLIVRAILEADVAPVEVPDPALLEEIETPDEPDDDTD
jgi:ribonuclease D